MAPVAADLPAAAQALLGGGDLAGVLAEREQVTDALCQDVEVLACPQLRLQAPVASDPRFLLSVLRVTPELERSHDLVLQIASPAGRIRAGTCHRTAAGRSTCHLSCHPRRLLVVCAR